jgi:hypothetical protein
MPDNATGLFLVAISLIVVAVIVAFIAAALFLRLAGRRGSKRGE